MLRAEGNVEQSAGEPESCMEDTENKKSIEELLAVMAALRTPETGCPWDLEQNFSSIAPYTIEEAYEVADAIERGDLADLKDELGDLLLQVVYHARMAEEAGAFDFADVTGAIVAKMTRRHPHVFGSAEQRAAGAAKGFWERIKAQEKADKAKERARLAPGSPSPAPLRALSSVVGDVPIGLPALTRAVKLQAKAARVGFDWPSLGPVFDKMREELAELEEVALPADPRSDQERGTSGPSRSPARDMVPEPDMKKIKEEFGDLLFVMANVARHLEIDAETALRGANEKFVGRFQRIEAWLGEQGKSPAQSDLAEMDALWDRAKQEERS